jgi:hypothetical protein
MSEYIVSVSGRRLPYLGPRTINFYDDAIVITRFPRWFHLRGFLIGAKGGRSIRTLGMENVDRMQGQEVDHFRGSATQVFELAKQSSSEELASADARNRRYPVEDIESAMLRVRKGRWQKVTLQRRDGRPVVFYSKVHGRTLQVLAGGLKKALGERLKVDNPDRIT